VSVIKDCAIQFCEKPKGIKDVVINRVALECADDIYALFLEGVVTCKEIKVHRIDFCLNELHFDRTPTSLLGQDDLVDRRGFKFGHLKAMLKGVIGHSDAYAFKGVVNLIAVPANAIVDIYAVAGENNQKLKIASVKVERKAIIPSFQSSWRPILLTSMGRSGTTWFMHLLREHPEVFIHEEYPHELLMIQYWTNMLVSLTTPLESDRLYDKWKIRDLRSQTVKSNVYYRKDVMNTRTLKYLGSSYIEEMAEFCVSSIDKAYQTIVENSYENEMTRSPMSGVKYISEKGLIYKDLIKEIYPGSKHIFLIRDIRDNIASSKAFNEKRGTKGFGEEKAKDDADFVRLRCSQFNQRYAEFKGCEEMAHFVRYEDMVNEPNAMLKSVLAYLMLDNSDEVVDEMIARASEENVDMKQHQTSEKKTSTTGRWKRDLAPELQELCKETSCEALKAWGYEL